MAAHRNIIVGVTGGIAAYKVPQLVRLLKKGGADVRVVMTEAATEFATPVALSTLSGHEVVVGTFPQTRRGRVDMRTWHIDLAGWADVMAVAPATANVIAKLANGYADDALTTLALALRCPLVVAPAMDADMWGHPAVQKNVDVLRGMGCVVLPPETGELASGLWGTGRLPELDSLANAIDRIARNAHMDMVKRRVLVTAGPTYEPIDPVRFIGNRSTGTMGFALASAAAQRGAEVTLIAGPVHLPTPRNVRRIDVETAEQMRAQVMKNSSRADIVIMAAAVSDYAPARTAPHKLKKEGSGETLSLCLHRTDDILQELGDRGRVPTLVGFALETRRELQYAREKLRTKHLDMIVVNNPLRTGAGFGRDTNIVTILSKGGKVERLPKMSKQEVAQEILNRLARRRRAK